jgi:hypothetical protein
MELGSRTGVEWRLALLAACNAHEGRMRVEATRETASPLLRAFAPLHRLAMGVACGVVLGGMIFLVTLIAVTAGLRHRGQFLPLLGQYFIGYTVTWSGAFVGLLWGLATGFLLGWAFAFLRNFVFWSWLVLIRSRAEMEQYSDFLDHM